MSMIALLQAYRSNLLTFQNIKKNIIAGIIVGIIALPLSMAFAIASDVTPITGIYTAIIAGFIVGVFGGTQVQISGPTGAFVIILSNIVATHGFIGLQCATLIAGLLLVIMGFFKLGSAVKFIPYPVIVGFTTGIGMIIFISQWPTFLGLPITIPTQMDLLHKTIFLIKSLPQLHLPTTVLAYVSLCIYFLSHQYIKNVPAPLITLLGTTLIHLLWGNNEIATIGSTFGQIPQQLPTFYVPDFSSVHWFALLAPACTIALLGAIESLLSATAIDAITNTKHHPNQELIGQGMANIITPFFGGFASTGAIARTITNIRNGGNCPISAITHCLFLLLILYFFAPYAAYIPLCSLASILFIIAYNMSDLHTYIYITRNAPWYDIVVLTITCMLTIMVDLVIAVTFGSLIAILLFTLRMYQTSDSGKKYIFATLWKESITQVVTSACQNNTILFKIKGPFFFGAADKLEQALAVTDTDPACIIFDFQQVPFIDMTGLTVFYKIVQQYHQRGIKIYIQNAHERIIKKLKTMHIDQYIEKK